MDNMNSSGFVMFFIIFIVSGTLCLWYSTVFFKKHQLNLLHEQHYEHVKQEDVVAYTKSFGWALLILGISCVLTAMLSMITFYSCLIFIVGFIISVSMMWKAQKKYNNGLF